MKEVIFSALNDKKKKEKEIFKILFQIKFTKFKKKKKESKKLILRLINGKNCLAISIVYISDIR